MKQIKTIPTFGDISEDVRTIQTELSNLGFNPIMVDGIFGNDTKKIISKFQKSKDLPGSGIIGPRTIAFLGIELESSVNTDGQILLSWERNHPERKEWTEIAVKIITEVFDESLANCEDVTTFRTDYSTLDKTKKIYIWAELISAMAKFESGWKLNSWMVETSMSIDPITGRQVRSEGLLQLSYQDKRSYSSIPCNFNWEADKNLGDNDLNKTIFDPFNNLDFGIRILARQVKSKNKIVLERGVYWAVIKLNGRYSKIREISNMVNSLRF